MSGSDRIVPVHPSTHPFTDPNPNTIVTLSKHPQQNTYIEFLFLFLPPISTVGVGVGVVEAVPVFVHACWVV